MDESETASPAESFSKEELKLAMKAFRERHRLTRLDDESRLGHGAMTSGGKSGVVAIASPLRSDAYSIVTAIIVGHTGIGLQEKCRGRSMACWSAQLDPETGLPARTTTPATVVKAQAIERPKVFFPGVMPSLSSPGLFRNRETHH